MVAQFLVLPPEDQIAVFNTLSRHQPPPALTAAPLISYRTSVPFALDNAQSIWENQPVAVTEAPAPAPAVVQKKKKKQQKQKKMVMAVELAPLSDTCIQVCDMSDCVCRYTLSETDQENDTVPELVLEGLYIYLGQTQKKPADYWYARIAKSLPFQLNQKQLYITHNRTEAYLTLNTHDDAAKAYVSLLQNEFRVNWMRARHGDGGGGDE